MKMSCESVKSMHHSSLLLYLEKGLLVAAWGWLAAFELLLSLRTTLSYLLPKLIVVLFGPELFVVLHIQ
jgi:hypothetical protein